jgi:hypothetical protein
LAATIQQPERLHVSRPDAGAASTTKRHHWRIRRMSAVQPSSAVFTYEPVATRVIAQHLSPTAVDWFVVNTLTVGLVTTVTVQKLAVPVGGLLEVCALTTLTIMGFLFYKGRAQISPLRLVLYLATFTMAFVIQSFSPASNIGSFLLTCLTSLPLIVVVETNTATLMAFLKRFNIVALIVVSLVFFDHVMQFSGIGMPNIEKIMPNSLIFLNYVYIQPLYYGSHFDKPNAIFFLEASFTCQFIAFAMIWELVFFRRLTFLLAFGAGMLATTAGTGFVLLLSCSPFYAFKYLQPKLIALGAFIMAIVLVVGLSTGFLDIFTNRATEFDKSGSSAHARFVEPFVSIGRQFTDAPVSDLLFGMGGGSQEKSIGLMLIPPTKMLLEYGVVVMLLYMTFALVSIFGSGVPLVCSWAAAVYFFIMNGSSSQPISADLACFVAAICLIRKPTTTIPFVSLDRAPEPKQTASAATSAVSPVFG